MRPNWGSTITMVLHKTHSACRQLSLLAATYWLRGAVTALILGVFGTLGSADATTVTYDFTVTATSGPLSGDTSTGSFSFASSLEVPNTFDSALGLLSSLNFTWDAITYTAATANTGYLDFGPTGLLDSYCFGNDVNASGCFERSGTTDFVVGGSSFTYSVVGSGIYFGTASFSPASVPEPITLSIFGAGLVGAVSLRRRKKKSA